MADLTIRVPGEHVEDVRDSLLHAYASVAEALHLAALRHLEVRGDPGDLLGHRTELLDLDGALEQIGFELGVGAAAAAVELHGHPEVLADALAGALGLAVERLSAAAAGMLRGDGGPDAARAALRAVGERLAALEGVL